MTAGKDVIIHEEFDQWRNVLRPKAKEKAESDA
jgi:hypothetical protein